MTKTDIIQAIHREIQLPQKDVRTIVNHFLHTLKKSIQEDKRIELRRFGTFGTKQHKYHNTAHNSQSYFCTTYFKVSKRVKDLL